MSHPAIEVSGLSKRYVIEHESRHDNLRDTLHHSARKLWRRLRWGTGFEREEFWALRDVSFSIQPGEVVGIIGRNGAGKSTLLKILSRITEPTSGKIALRGRVASLLEVGTGFHPDLTGRENIFLNGAILGMSRAEIRAKFDEIVAFAEIERFLDTPVKRYSSGMYVRLAFAVAAHLEPEILIVDEVLAVGDAQFQKKCLGKMQDVARGQGRTVLFVSHQIDAIRSLCSRCLLFASGRLAEDGSAGLVVTSYLSARTNDALATIRGDLGARLASISLHPEMGGGLNVRLRIEADSILTAPVIGIVLRTEDHRAVIGTNTQMNPPTVATGPSRAHEAVLSIPSLPLHSDRYFVSVYIGDRDRHLLTLETAATLDWVAPVAVLNRPPLHQIGPVLVPATWSISSL